LGWVFQGAGTTVYPRERIKTEHFVEANMLNKEVQAIHKNSKRISAWFKDGDEQTHSSKAFQV
jgi:hypothetical protein